MAPLPAAKVYFLSGRTHGHTRPGSLTRPNNLSAAMREKIQPAQTTGAFPFTQINTRPKGLPNKHSKAQQTINIIILIKNLEAMKPSVAQHGAKLLKQLRW